MTGVFRLPIVRPKTRGECASGPRPCPWVSCRHHLYLDVDKNGSVIEHARCVDCEAWLTRARASL